MTYSIEILNQYNERALDFNDVLYKHESGSMGKWFSQNGHDAYIDTAPHETINAGFRGLLHNNLQYTNQIFRHLGSNATVVNLPQYMTSNVSVKTGFGSNLIYAQGAIPTEEVEVFVELPPDGIHHLTVYVQRYTSIEQGTMCVCQPHHTYGGTLSYVLARTSKPGPATSDTHGMLMFDENGNNVFDSRYEVFGVKDHVFIPRSDLNDVMYNNAVREYPLRTTFSNPYISSGDYNSARYIGGDPIFLYYPLLQIVNGNTLRISRAGYYLTPSGTGAIDYGYAHDSTVFIAEV